MKNKLLFLGCLTVPASIYFSLVSNGFLTFFGVFYGFVIIPVIELILKPISSNLSESEEATQANNIYYDLLLYLTVPFQFGALYMLVKRLEFGSVNLIELIGLTLSYGLSCGVLGINAAHELGHRKSWWEKLMANLLLMTSLYMHFFIEHNKGHHRHVATREDPASARRGEWVYLFYVRSIFGSWLSAFNLDRNLWVVSIFTQVLFLSLIYYFFNATVFVAVLGGAIFGILLLETVNYIEHYGLERKILPSGRHEKTEIIHSWNSDHPWGRAVLFNLSRHSDHHANVNRPYQVLRSFKDSPQLPTGYSAMMLLSLIPPLYFRLMNRLIDQNLKSNN